MASKNAAISPVPMSSGLLDGMSDLSDLSALLNAPPGAAPVVINKGEPLALDMSLIDEDPDQPRTVENPGFSKESLNELAASIALRGVKTPISVRENLEEQGRFIINHGACRFRASKLAGKTTIPGYIDNDYNHADQVVENLIRNNLTPREIANHIGRELAKGILRKDIAKAISKSAAFVTQHATLLDLPDSIAVVFNNGRAKDVTVINELVNLHKKDAEKVAAWLADTSIEITRGSVKELRDFIESSNKEDSDVVVPITAISVDGTQNITGVVATADCDSEGVTTTPNIKTDDVSGKIETAAKTSIKSTDPSKIKKAIVQVWYDGRPARILLDRRPPAEGVAYIKYDDDGHEVEVDLGEVKLLAILEGG